MIGINIDRDGNRGDPAEDDEEHCLGEEHPRVDEPVTDRVEPQHVGVDAQ